MLYRFILSLTVASFTSLAAFSQTLMVEKAYQHLGRGELTKSLEAIELAAQNELTAKDPKTWYLKAYICKELYKAQPQENAAYREQARQAVERCKALDAAQTFSQKCEAITAYLDASYFNEAIRWLNAGKYEEALPVLQRFTTDPLHPYYAEASYYSGYASLMLAQEQQAGVFFKKALAARYQDPLVYETLGNQWLQQDSLTAAADLIRQGRTLFPENRGLRIAELNLLMAQQNYSEAEIQVQKYLALYPDDVEAMLVGGTVYDKLFQRATTQRDVYFQRRKQIYHKILSREPDHLMANYNMGITLYNQAVKIINEQTETYEVDIFTFNQLLEQCTALFKEALPYIQKANQLKPDHVNTLKAMQGIYYNLNDRENFNQVQARIEALEKK